MEFQRACDPRIEIELVLTTINLLWKESVEGLVYSFWENYTDNMLHQCSDIVRYTDAHGMFIDDAPFLFFVTCMIYYNVTFKYVFKSTSL